MALHKEEEQICREIGNAECLQKSLGKQIEILMFSEDFTNADF